MHRFRLLALTVALGSSCQTYDFERVEPFGVSQRSQVEFFASRRLKPNIMLLVDNSGSMLLPTDPGHPQCGAGCGTQTNPCSASCPTRVSELRAAMDSFLRNRGTVARFGLTVFPQVDTDQCRAPVVVNESIPLATRNDEGTDQALINNALKVNDTLRAITATPIGGTPTGAALAFVGGQPSLNDRDDQRLDLVLLLTDGLPNCNATHSANTCDCVASGCSQARLDACACTLGACDLGANRCNIGCLDQDDTVTQVKALLQRDIQTVVVGFGADVNSGPGPAVLNAMANAGGFARKCPNDTTAECGGGACNTTTHLCEQAFYAARNAGELEQTLAAISDSFTTTPCEFVLKERPDDASLLAVLIDGSDVQRSDATWSYDDPKNAVIFKGAICDRLMASTPQDPVTLEFRIVNRF